MMLKEFAEDVYFAKRPIAAASQYQYLVAVNSITRFCGDALPVADLSAELVNRWVAYITPKLAPATARNRRRHLLTLWIAAWRAKLCQERPDDIRRVPFTWHPPAAWTFEQVQKLLAAALKLTGTYPSDRFFVGRGKQVSVRRSVFWSVLIQLAWDTGLRQGDLFALELEQIGPDGVIEITQRKTRRWHTCKLNPSTLASVRASFPPDREKIVEWHATHQLLEREFKALVRAAGIPRGTLKKLRKSSATEVELHYPGCGGAHLGHASEVGIAGNHYLDPRLLVATKPMPRALREIGGGA